MSRLLAAHRTTHRPRQLAASFFFGGLSGRPLLFDLPSVSLRPQFNLSKRLAGKSPISKCLDHFGAIEQLDQLSDGFFG
jgi:hypothetical protein